MILAVMVVIVVPVLLEWSEQKREYRAVEAELTETLAEVELLEAELENWSDDSYISAQARARLGYVEPGETQFSVADPPEGTALTPADAATPTGPPKPWVVLLHSALQEAAAPPPVKDAAEDPTVTPVEAEE